MIGPRQEVSELSNASGRDDQSNSSLYHKVLSVSTSPAHKNYLVSMHCEYKTNSTYKLPEAQKLKKHISYKTRFGRAICRNLTDAQSRLGWLLPYGGGWSAGRVREFVRTSGDRSVRPRALSSSEFAISSIPHISLTLNKLRGVCCGIGRDTGGI